MFLAIVGGVKFIKVKYGDVQRMIVNSTDATQHVQCNVTLTQTLYCELALTHYQVAYFLWVKVM